MLDRDQVLHVARLARLELTDEEVERMAAELSHVLDHIEKIRELDLDGVPPTSHVVDVVNALRPDEPEPVAPARGRACAGARAGRGRLRRPEPRAQRDERADRADGAQPRRERVRAGEIDPRRAVRGLPRRAPRPTS